MATHEYEVVRVDFGEFPLPNPAEFIVIARPVGSEVWYTIGEPRSSEEAFADRDLYRESVEEDERKRLASLDRQRAQLRAVGIGE